MFVADTLSVTECFVVSDKVSDTNERGTHFWEEDPDAISVCCPDAINLVVFEIRRVKSIE